MKAEITFSQLYWNHSLMNFFFRDQAERTLNDLMDRAVDKPGAIEAVEEYADTYDYDVDAIEEMFYDESVESLAEEFGIEIEPNEDDEEEE